jgi:hypothetical protein
MGHSNILQIVSLYLASNLLRVAHQDPLSEKGLMDGLCVGCGKPETMKHIFLGLQLCQDMLATCSILTLNLFQGRVH